MDDEELRRLLASAGWRLFYTYEDGEEEFTGPSDSDTPNLLAIRMLVDEAIAAEREACAKVCEAETDEGAQYEEAYWSNGAKECARLIRERSNV